MGGHALLRSPLQSRTQVRLVTAELQRRRIPSLLACKTCGYRRNNAPESALSGGCACRCADAQQAIGSVVFRLTSVFFYCCPLPLCLQVPHCLFCRASDTSDRSDLSDPKSQHPVHSVLLSHRPLSLRLRMLHRLFCRASVNVRNRL